VRDVITRLSVLVERGRRIFIFAVLCVVIASLAHQAVKGDHGLERRAQIKQRIEAMEARRVALGKKRKRLERDVALMKDAGKTPTDLAETQALSILNLARPGDIILLNVPTAVD